MAPPASSSLMCGPISPPRIAASLSCAHVASYASRKLARASQSIIRAQLCKCASCSHVIIDPTAFTDGARKAAA